MSLSKLMSVVVNSLITSLRFYFAFFGLDERYGCNQAITRFENWRVDELTAIFNS